MKTINKLALLTLLVSTAGFSQVLVGCNDCGTSTYRKPVSSHTQRSTVRIPATPSLIVGSLYSGGRLDDMIRFIDSLNGQVDYYTYGEVFLPLKNQIGTLKTVRSVYGEMHQETFNATMIFLNKVDANWEQISQFKNTEIFFETINYFELIILKLKRDTYL